MKKWESIRDQLQQILNTDVRLLRIPVEKWDPYEANVNDGAFRSIERDDEIWFQLQEDNGTVLALAIPSLYLTGSERRLVEMMIHAYQVNDHSTYSPAADEERTVDKLKHWLLNEISEGTTHKELPDTFASIPTLFTSMVPLLLNGDYSNNKKISYTELHKLLESFFQMEILLIPLLDKEWLILVPEQLVDQDDDIREFLENVSLGLYEMMVNEGIGECHLSIDEPIIPAKSLLRIVVRLREAISLGRIYQVGQNIHLPWDLQLERVLNLLPDAEKKHFIETVFKRNNLLSETEMLSTLESFFHYDCNVSETAKELYIHRNTLLYRLDKFKQETGLDVRSFNDAVLVKICLLLYKVTKSK